MPDPSPLQIVLDEVRLVRADLAAFRSEMGGYTAARCEAHTERLLAIGSRLDAADLAQRAVTDSRDWPRKVALVLLAAGLAFAGSMGAWATQRAIVPPPAETASR